MYKYLRWRKIFFHFLYKHSKKSNYSKRLTHPLRGSQTGCLLHMSLSILRTITQDLSPFTRAWEVLEGWRREKKMEGCKTEDCTRRGRKEGNKLSAGGVVFVQTHTDMGLLYTTHNEVTVSG